MSRILISYFSDYGETTYESLTRVLKKYNNDIFRLNINTSKIKKTQWGGDSFCNDQQLKMMIEEFDPEVILNFNNSFPQDVYLSSFCKNCVIDADAPFVFWNKKLIKENISNPTFVGLQKFSKKMYEDFFKISLSDKNYLFCPVGTLIQNNLLEQDKNISFIGSNFLPIEIPEGLDFYSNEAIRLYEAFKNNYFLSIEEAKKICKNCSNIDWLYEKVGSFFVGQDRLKHLQLLTDMGLTLYGVRSWDRIAFYDFELAKCYNPKRILTLEDSELVYNSSKISINISHPQAKTSFSWRVMDIMASNACLLMEDKPDWHDLFDKYLSKETLEHVIYHDRYDLREKAQKLIFDDKLRKRCVQELNYAISMNGRWEHRFALLEKHLNLHFLESKENEKRYYFIKEYHNVTTSSSQLTLRKRSYIIYSFIRCKFKIYAYLLLLFIISIPLIDMCISDRFKNKIFMRLSKYWHRGQ